MKYRSPVIEDHQILKEYVAEHYANGERSISASLGLTGMDYVAWVDKVNRSSREADKVWGRYYLYLAFDENGRLIGLLNIRFSLSDALREEYGDVGYGVRPSERCRGYATEMLRYALSVCREKGMSKVVLGCYKDNPASAATIRKNGGVLFAENEKYKAGRISQYYSIAL